MSYLLLLLIVLLLPSPDILIPAISKITKAFEDVVQVELVKIRWEEIKRLEAQPASALSQ